MYLFSFFTYTDVFSLVHVSVHVSVHVFISLSCVFFSLSNVCTCSGIHCVALCFPFLVCCMLLCCVQDVVIVMYVRMCSV